MRNRRICMMMVCTLAVTLLAGCGDGSFFLEEKGTETPATLTSDPILPEEDVDILNYEQKYQSGEFTQEDYRALADLYQDKGLIRRQRDLLEQSCRMYGDEQAFETLQSIAVNLEEEDPEIREEAQTMLQNLELEEYQGESIHMISSPEWFASMMPKLSDGVRNYFLLQDGQEVLAIQAGYREDGTPFSSVWYEAGEQTILLGWEDNTVQMFTCSAAGGSYNGEFTRWTINGDNGDIKKEQGTMADGHLTGDYQADVHLGADGSGDVYDLWSNRETMEYTTYIGAFDEAGVTTMEQPSAASLASDTAACVVYAYDKDRKNCLYIEVPEGEQTAGFVFGAAAMGISAPPTFSVYEPVEEEGAEQTETEEIPQVRIFDGEIQVLSGNTWVPVGSVSRYQKEDPFQAYAEQKEQSDKDKRNTAVREDGGEDGNRPGISSLEPEKPKTSEKPQAPSTPSTTKPSTPKPSTPSTPKPSTPPAPEPEPSDDNDDGGDNGGGQPDVGGDTGNEGGDVDIEWTPDLM